LVKNYIKNKEKRGGYMTILVAGGAGYIGSHTCVELFKEGHDIVIIDNLVNAYRDVIEKNRIYNSKKVYFYEAGVGNSDVLEEILKSDNEWSIAILRYFNTIGAHSSGLIGEEPNWIPDILVPYIAKVAIEDLEYLKVFGNDYSTKDGTGVRDYIHIS
jgi:UDP-glucose 4-epimerase